jgi:MFS family permease
MGQNRSVTSIAEGAISRVTGFIGRQKHNYRVAITRSAANSFLINLTAQYDSIFTVGLGAGSIELGTVSSIGGAISALISAPVGWLVDRYGLKRFYLIGIALMAGAALMYALAPRWQMIIAATILISIATRLTATGCSVLCADSVHNEDRATAQNICVTCASILSMIAPLVAVWLITGAGGLTVEGIRPLYYIRFAGYILIFLFVAVQLKELRTTEVCEAGAKHGFVDDFKQLFAASPSSNIDRASPLRRWLIVIALTWFPFAMTAPFLQLFAHQVRGADQYLLGVMATATVLTRVLFGIPLGRLADKIGRKKVIYLLTPLWYASYLLLVFSSGPITLILAGALQAFYLASSGITGAMSVELVPVEQVGKWSGMIGLFRGLITIPAPILGGLVWDHIDPVYVFLIPVAMDLLFKLPLLVTIPETLRARENT